MDSADSFLPFQDWRWLVTRRDDIEKTMIACHRKCWVALMAATKDCGRMT